MITAEQARERIEKVIAESEEKSKKQAIEFCEKLDAAIIKKADARESNLIVDVPYALKHYVSEELTKNGYKVKAMHGSAIIVEW